VLSSTPPLSDISGHYNSVFMITDSTKHVEYTAIYSPNLSNYHKLTTLDAIRQNISQEVAISLPSHTAVEWRLIGSRSPSWAGAPLAGSMFGQLVMQLTGVNALELLQNVTSGASLLSINHRSSLRKSIELDCAGGISRYRKQSTNDIISALTAPDSTTWYNEVSASYGYSMQSHKSIGLGVSSAYFRFTAPDSHVLEESVQLHYSQDWASGWNYVAGIGPELHRSQVRQGGIQLGLSASVGINHKTSRSAFQVQISNEYTVQQEQDTLTSWIITVSDQHALTQRWFVGDLMHYRRTNTGFGVGYAVNGNRAILDSGISGGYHITRNTNWFINYGWSVASGITATQGTIYRQQLITGISFDIARVKVH